MVSAELIHNPYLLETDARFNGRSPKVNSAIEQFKGRPLVEWADEVPNTYRDEMNGLDFDLSFTGTDADYLRIIKAFKEQGIDIIDTSSDNREYSTGRAVNSYDVRLTHKRALEDVRTKRYEIEGLLEWLESHPNRRFNYDEFVSTHSEALDGSVPYIIVNENSIQLDLPSVSVETVDSARYDLFGTELTNTPLLFMIDPSNSAQFRNELLYVLNRPDIEQGQLFFYIHPSMNQERAIRVISDLGVEEPQIVKTPDDPMVMQYLDDYPSMRYIRRCVRILRATTDEISEELEKAGAESVVTNANRSHQIAKLDSVTRSYQKARSRMDEVPAFESDAKIGEYCQRFENHVNKWRNKKPGVTGQDQILQAAGDLDSELRGWVREAETDIVLTMSAEQQRIEEELSSIFDVAKPATSFSSGVRHLGFRGAVVIPNVMDALISNTEVERVNPKNDFFGFFGGTAGSDDEPEYVEVASYDVWRAIVTTMLIPAIQKAAAAWKQELVEYRTALVDEYSQELDALSRAAVQKKETETAMLSDEERMLEEDKDWLLEFENRLHAIERD